MEPFRVAPIRERAMARASCHKAVTMTPAVDFVSVFIVSHRVSITLMERTGYSTADKKASPCRTDRPRPMNRLYAVSSMPKITSRYCFVPLQDGRIMPIYNASAAQAPNATTSKAFRSGSYEPANPGLPLAEAGAASPGFWNTPATPIL